MVKGEHDEATLEELRQREDPRDLLSKMKLTGPRQNRSDLISKLPTEELFLEYVILFNDIRACEVRLRDPEADASKADRIRLENSFYAWVLKFGGVFGEEYFLQLSQPLKAHHACNHKFFPKFYAKAKAERLSMDEWLILGDILESLIELSVCAIDTVPALKVMGTLQDVETLYKVRERNFFRIIEIQEKGLESWELMSTK